MDIKKFEPVFNSQTLIPLIDNFKVSLALNVERDSRQNDLPAAEIESRKGTLATEVDVEVVLEGRVLIGLQLDWHLAAEHAYFSRHEGHPQQGVLVGVQGASVGAHEKSSVLEEGLVDPPADRVRVLVLEDDVEDGGQVALAGLDDLLAELEVLGLYQEVGLSGHADDLAGSALQLAVALQLEGQLEVVGFDATGAEGQPQVDGLLPLEEDAAQGASVLLGVPLDLVEEVIHWLHDQFAHVLHLVDVQHQGRLDVRVVYDCHRQAARA
jgi:hypothetical protein